jgi:hypothetical protein
LKFEENYIPKNGKELFNLLAHGYYTDSNINSVIENMSAYPITKLQFLKPSCIKEDSIFEGLRQFWENLLTKKLDIRVFNISMGYDYNLYGNAFAVVYRPFDRWLLCSHCSLGHNTRISSTIWRWKHAKFQINCQHCKQWVDAGILDKPVADPTKIKFVRLSPFNIEIKHNHVTGSNRYRYTIPNDVRAAILAGDPDHLLNDPSEIIKAVQGNIKKGVEPVIEFNEDNIFAMQRPAPSLPGQSSVGWGMPPAVSALRDVFFKNIMRRAQAMVLHEHIIPFRIFSPSYVESPSPLVNLGTWRSQLESSYYKWRSNPLSIMTSPIPVNVQQVGAQGRALTLFAEIQETDKSTIKALKVPREFVEGGLTYSGSSVSLRMLENILMDFVQRSNRMVSWLIKKISVHINLIAVEAEYTPFKMADDVQQKQILLNLYDRSLISSKKLGDANEYDAVEEAKLRAKEDSTRMVEQARAQAEANQRLSAITAEYGAAAPTAIGNFNNPADPNTVKSLADQIKLNPNEEQKALDAINQVSPETAQATNMLLNLDPTSIYQDLENLSTLPEDEMRDALTDLQQQNPKKYAIMKLFFQPKIISTLRPPVPKDNSKGGIDMRPAPNVLPPRRTSGVAM